MNARKAGRRQTGGRHEALARYQQADAYLIVAELVTKEPDQPADYNFNHVAAGNASLAAIAASDAICYVMHGERARGQDHHDAVPLLGTVRFGNRTETESKRHANRLQRDLATVLDLKDESHYGLSLLGIAQVKTMLRATRRLVEAAAEALGIPARGAP